MANIPLGLGDWESETQNMSRLKLHNMYVVANPASTDGVSRVSRPTLRLNTTVGSGPIYEIWRQPNVFNGDRLVVSGSELYRLQPNNSATKIGDIPGTDVPEIVGTQIAGSPDLVFIVRNNLLYFTSGTTLELIDVPDDQLVESVDTLNGYFIFSIKGTQKFYWTEPGDTVVQPLNFASAERIPDPIKSVAVVSDELWFLGESGPEVWAPTGDADAPFQRVSGRVYKEGCFSRATVVTTSIEGTGALLWVTDTKAVVKAQGVPSKVSNESVEEILKTSDDLTTWFFRYNRHDFFVINSPLFTLVYDITADTWPKWSSYLLPFWKVQCGFQVASVVYAGDITSNKIYELEEGVADEEDPVLREVAGFVAQTGKPVKCNELIAQVNSGWSPSYDVEPTLELRWSDDLGATWTNYLQTSMGKRGEYAKTVSYRSLGLIKSPGRIFEFRMSDRVRFRIDYATFNERDG